MDNFIRAIHTLSMLDKEAGADLQGKIKTGSVNKGDYLLRQGEVCRKIFFINEGLVKTSFDGDGKEFIMKFFHENSIFTVIDSYIRQIPSAYSVIALEPVEFSFIELEDIEALAGKHHSVEVFQRKLFSLAAVNMMNRISEMLEENATMRYNNFVRENKPLLQRISLGDLSGYLGITQVSLSRIRAKK